MEKKVFKLDKKQTSFQDEETKAMTFIQDDDPFNLCQ